MERVNEPDGRAPLQRFTMPFESEKTPKSRLRDDYYVI